MMEASNRRGSSPHIAGVLKHVKHYIEKQRREDGFDLSGPEKPCGEFTVFSGGSHYFNYHQDQQLQCILESYNTKPNDSKSISKLLSKSSVERLKGSSEKDNTQLFQESIQLDKDRLVMTVAQLLLEESAVPLSESLSSLSTLQSTSRKKGNSSRKSLSSSSVSLRSHSSIGTMERKSHKRSHSAKPKSMQSECNHSLTVTPNRSHTDQHLNLSISENQLRDYHKTRSSNYTQLRSVIESDNSNRYTPINQLYAQGGRIPVYIPLVRRMGSNDYTQSKLKSRNCVGFSDEVTCSTETCTDVITCEVSTQTVKHTSTQTEVSSLAGKSPPLYRKPEGI